MLIYGDMMIYMAACSWKQPFRIHCGITLTPPMMPTVATELRPASQVRFSWKTSTKRAPRSRSRRPSGDSSMSAVHHFWRSESIVKRSAVRELQRSFRAVNSTREMRPWRRFEGLKSSLAPRRRLDTQSAKMKGGSRFTSCHRQRPHEPL